MKWLIFFIYFHSCHFYHRVYYELTMACSPDCYVRVSLNFFRFLFNRSGCLFNCEDHFHFYSLFNGNKEKSYLRLSLKSFQWLFSTFIFKKNMENIPFLFAPRFNELLQSGEVELSGAPKYTFLIENNFKHLIKQYRRLHWYQSAYNYYLKSLSYFIVMLVITLKV